MKKTPGVKITEISTIIGNEWKDLTEDEKNVSKHNNIYRSGEKKLKKKSLCMSSNYTTIKKSSKS